MTFTGASTTSLFPVGPYYYGFSGSQNVDNTDALTLFNIDGPRRVALLSRVQVTANLANFGAGEELHLLMTLNGIITMEWLMDGTAALLIQQLNTPFHFILPPETNLNLVVATDSADEIPVTAAFIGRRIE